jgi:hypothetical protein
MSNSPSLFRGKARDNSDHGPFVCSKPCAARLALCFSIFPSAEDLVLHIDLEVMRVMPNGRSVISQVLSFKMDSARCQLLCSSVGIKQRHDMMLVHKSL